MSFNFSNLSQSLAAAAIRFDTAETETLCKDLQQFLQTSGEAVDTEHLERVLQVLRKQRLFPLMQQMGDCFLRTGRTSYKIRRLYAQALIDGGIYSGALAILNELVGETKNNNAGAAAYEYREGMGLTGRVYKQLYVNAGRPDNPLYSDILKQAIDSYLSIYNLDKKENLWHGINAVALLKRAEADHIQLTGYPDAAAMAADILYCIESKDADISGWDFATAMEAAVALNRPEEAIKWADRYVAIYDDKFAIGSTLRQLEEVWRLNEETGPGVRLLPLLKACMLKNEEGGSLVLSRNDFKKQPGDADDEKNLEKVLGDTTYKTFQWYEKGKKCCYPVARIGREVTKGVGTGFLMQGKHFHPELTGRLVLVTNAHVVSDTPEINNDSLLPAEAVVSFELIDPTVELRVDRIFFTSSRRALDVSVLLFDDDSYARLEQLMQGVNFYHVAPALPQVDGKERLYIIGHPAGGGLQISLQDNVFLAQKEPYLHYRTPTTGGSSGSPVFNGNWDLVGLHHAGYEKMKKLDGSRDTYAANEGIWIQSIIKAVQESKQ